MSRTRVIEVEACHHCGAPVGKPCVNYKRKPKAPCVYSAACRRCGAQAQDCRCGVLGPHPARGWLSLDERQPIQAELFPVPEAGHYTRGT